VSEQTLAGPPGGSEPAPATESPQSQPDPSLGKRLLTGVMDGNAIVVTFLALVVALAVGAVLIALADAPTRAAAQYFTAAPGDTFTSAFSAIGNAYKAVFEGAIFNPGTAGNGTLSGIFYPLSETLTNATPLILAGLSVGVAFRAGLFNIGAQGQIILGAVFAGYVGFAWHLPVVLHLIVAILAGLIGGALWGGVVGLLKARTGAHEVITTIMLNYVAVYLLGFLLSVRGFQAPPYGQAISNTVDKNARYPALLGSSMRVHFGLIVALLAAGAVWWLLTRTTIGFELRAVGANQFAARTAGMSVARAYITVMVIAGALAGLAGTAQILGTNSQITGDIDAGIGFNAITVALLGRASPGGTVLAGILFGALQAGGVQMSSSTGVPSELVNIFEALIVLFIAAPSLIRGIFRLREVKGGGGTALAKGWNG
jgi:general nucleoside transport system permease protein